jgi:hypothetical protein
MQIQGMFTCSCSLPRKSDSLTLNFLPFIIYSARVFTKVTITYPPVLQCRLRFSFKFLFGVFCKRDRLARLQSLEFGIVELASIRTITILSEEQYFVHFYFVRIVILY